MKTLRIRDISCLIVEGESAERIVYLIYPQMVPIPEDLLQEMAAKFSAAVAVVYIPGDDWNNFLTPWPEPPEAKGFPPFGGKAADFLALLRDEVIPQVEKEAGLASQFTRNLIGVSLSGLFALWQWMQCDLFGSIACLSGSFWYEGFMEWFDARSVPPKSGLAYFLLGRDEPKAKIKAYRPVGANTEGVVARLKAAGLPVEFEWVPGNHFTDPLGRLRLAFTHLFLDT